MAVDGAGLAAGGVRLVSGAAFLVDPLRANRWWGEREDPSPTTQLLLRSMGYRDALIGAMLVAASVRGGSTRGWFLVSGGADASDLLGAWSVRAQRKPLQNLVGLGGALVGVAVGVWGAARRRDSPTPTGQPASAAGD